MLYLKKKGNSTYSVCIYNITALFCIILGRPHIIQNNTLCLTHRIFWQVTLTSVKHSCKRKRLNDVWIPSSCITCLVLWMLAHCHDLLETEQSHRWCNISFSCYKDCLGIIQLHSCRINIFYAQIMGTYQFKPINLNLFKLKIVNKRY